MDAWITAAYPGPSTYRHPAVAVRHRLSKRRYRVDGAHRALLPRSVAAARARLAAFMGARCEGGVSRRQGGVGPARARGWRRCAGMPPPPADRAALARLRGPLNATGFRDFDMRFRGVNERPPEPA